MSSFLNIYHKIYSFNPVDLALKLTMLVILIYHPFSSFINLIILPPIILGIINQEFSRAKYFWPLIFSAMFLDLILRWNYVDNHMFLYAYWALTLALAFFPKFLNKEIDPEKMIQTNAKYLIGLVMLCAFLWKCLSPSFVDGSAMISYFYFDSRFLKLTSWITGKDLSSLFQYKSMLSSYKDVYLVPEAIHMFDKVPVDGNIRFFSYLFSWWIIIIEGLLAFFFLTAKKLRSEIIANILLVLFIATTYIFADVKGFGWILLILGIAQTTDKTKIFKLLYFVCFILIQIYVYLPF